MTAVIPPEAVAAAAEVLGTTTLDDRPVGTGDGDADAVVAGLMLEAAAPLIADEARRGERERLRRLADERGAWCASIHGQRGYWFSDLLKGDDPLGGDE